MRFATLQNPDAELAAIELSRISRGGQPHQPKSREGKAVERALVRLAADPATSGFADMTRKAIAEAAAAQVAAKAKATEPAQASEPPVERTFVRYVGAPLASADVARSVR